MLELLKDFIDIFLHLDKHLAEIVGNYSTWTYLILFLIIFCETGLVVTPFLPGDSLLFATGAIASTGALNIWLIILLLFIAAVIGDTLNYAIGKYIGPKVFVRDFRFLKRDHLIKTQAFYEKHGGKTIIFARFVPIIRTFAPFIAGVGSMNYPRFISYNIIGGALWIVIFSLAGFYFGEIPAVKRNFTVVIFGIIFISLIPAVIEFIRLRKPAK